MFSAKLVPVGYGIKKLHINAVVEDDKVSVDDLEEKITAFEDFVSILSNIHPNFSDYGNFTMLLKQFVKFRMFMVQIH